MNISNKKLGTDFENITCELLSNYFNKDFIPQKPIYIGQPAKPHKFDFVSDDSSIVCECKCYSWTKNDNKPSAKISVLNEAILYLSHLGKDIQKFLVLKKSIRISTQETLANYYLRSNNHLLQDVKIIEIDTENKTLKILN